MTNEVKCPACEKTVVGGGFTTVDRRTGKKAPGLGTLLFGIVCLAAAAFMLVLVIINWDDPVVPGQSYIFYPIILLVGGIPTTYAYLKADRIKIMTYKCASCGKTFNKDDLVRGQ